MINAVLAGLVTVHAAVNTVLAVFPQWQCQRCDGYIALESCRSRGRYYVLRYHSQDYLVRSIDCLNPADKESHDRYWSMVGPWIADVDEALWQGPWVPQRAEVWPLATYLRDHYNTVPGAQLPGEQGSRVLPSFLQKRDETYRPPKPPPSPLESCSSGDWPRRVAAGRGARDACTLLEVRESRTLSVDTFVW